MKVLSLTSVLAIGFFTLASASAADRFACPDAAKVAMDTQFGNTADGMATSDITQCLAVREEIKIAVNVSGAAINGKNGINQQVNNARNMVDNYENIYGLQQGSNGYQIAVIMHGSAGKYALEPSVYDSKYPADAGGNAATVKAINGLLSKGVKVFMCQNTMRSNGFVSADLIPGISEVPSGVTAVVDYGMRNWVVITP